ncbi:MAG TPA: choice-of-anchor D domain-containing protein [Bacteroidota bacterium]|nr:choice-of-anchor D domain-containing protein [Bacteroidota bacterium]
MKSLPGKLLSSLMILVVVLANASAQDPAPQQIVREAINPRIWSQAYWSAKARLGLVPVAEPSPIPPAVYGTSAITVPNLISTNSPDVPVSADTNTTQSENSIFVNPANIVNVLNSNNSTPWPVSGIYGSSGFFSTDGGTTWGGSKLGTGGSNSGDPAAVIDSAERFFVGYITSGGGQGVARSSNHGATWTAATVSTGGGGFLDKNHLWVDNAPSSAHSGNLYSAWTNFGGANNNNIEVSRSTDHGVTWSAPVNVSAAVSAGSHNQGVNIQTGPNGEVYAVWAIYDSWPSDETAIGFAKSTNGGVSFLPATRIITNIRGIRMSATLKNMRVASFPVAAVDISGGPSNGAIHVVWTNIGVPGINTGSDRDGYMIKSTDGGATWLSPARINQDPIGLGNEHFLHWISCDPVSGFLSVIFYDDRNTPPTSCETFVANSTNGGSSWVDFKVSDVSFTPAPIPGLAGGYFGDYLGIASRSGLVYPVWTDNRDGRAMAYVSPFAVEPDSIPPAAVSDLAAISPTSNTITLTWTASGDNGDTGRASFYDIRYSTSPINDGNFDSATPVTGEPFPKPVDSTESMEVFGLDFTTTYYFAMRAADEWHNPSPLSNVPSATTLGIPDIAITPDSLVDSLLTGETSDHTIFLKNIGQGTLDFTLSDFVIPVLANKQAMQNQDILNASNFIAPEKGEADRRVGTPVPFGAGGPDSAGYHWIDSDEPGGPAFAWTEISGFGTPIPLSDDSYYQQTLPFQFPFYGVDRSTVHISSNGYLTFGSASMTFFNTPIPDPAEPNSMIAAFWTDLNPGSGGQVYSFYDSLAGRFIVEYFQVPHFTFGGSYTLQVVLSKTGSIDLRYLALSPTVTVATVGIENTTGTDGLQMVFNAPYIHDSLAVRILMAPEFLDVTPAAGRIYAGDSLALTVTFDASGMFGGDYYDTIDVQSNDPDDQNVLVGAHLNVTGAPDIAVSDDTLGFGMVFVNYPDSLQLLILNSGTDTLSIDSLAFSDAHFSSPDTGAMSIGPLDGRNIQVRFIPTSAVPEAGTLTIYSNDADEPVVAVALSGVGLDPPDISVAPDSVVDSLYTGDLHDDTLTISNTGLSDLTFTITATSLFGAIAAPAVRIEPLGIPVPVAPPGSLRSAPAAARDAAGQGLTLSPEETAAGMYPAPASLGSVPMPFFDSFEDGNYDGWLVDGGTGTREVTGATAAHGAYSFRYQNSTGGHFQGIHQDFDAASQPGNVKFYVRASENNSASCYFVLVGDQYNTEVIWFYAGPSGYFYVNGDVGGDESYPYNVNQWYKVEYRDIDWDGKRFDYYIDGTLIKASIPFRNASYVNQCYRLYLYNFYATNAWWDGIGIGGSNWATPSPASGTVPAGFSQQVVVSVDAEGLPGGDYYADLTISSNDPDEQIVVVPAHLHVTAASDISIADDSLDFGETFIGYPETLPLLVTNQGTDSLVIDGLSSDDAHFTLPATLPLTVPPSGTVNIDVQFSPTDPVVESGTLTVHSNDPTDTVSMVTLIGEGIHPPQITVNPESLYANLFSGMTTVDTVTVSNSGLGSLTYRIQLEPGPASLMRSYAGARIDGENGPSVGRPDIQSVRPSGPVHPWETAGGMVVPASPGMSVAVPFFDSFEDGNYDGWTTDAGAGTREVTSATAGHGAYSFRYQNSTEGHFHGIHQDFDPASQPEHVGFYVRASENNSASCYFVLVGDLSNTEVIWFFAHPAGYFYVNGDVGGDESHSYNANQWYKIEFRNIDWVLKQFDYHVDGDLVKAAIPFRNAFSVNQFSRLYLYNYYSTNAWWDGISVGGGVEWLTVDPPEGTILPGDSGKIAVTFNSTDLIDGDYDGIIRFINNDPAAGDAAIPAHFHVVGIPEIAVSPDTIDYDTVFVTGHWTDSLMVSNPGTKTLQVTSLISDNPSFTVGAGALSLDPYKSQNVGVTFSPGDTGYYTGTLTLASNDTSDPTVIVSLSGYAIPPPVLSYSIDSLSFHLGEGDSAETSFIIANLGLTPLHYRLSVEEPEDTAVTTAGRAPRGGTGAANITPPAIREISSAGPVSEYTAAGMRTGPASLTSVPMPFSDSFEDGNYDGWTNGGGAGTREVTNATAAHGAYSFRYQNSSYGHFHGIHQDFDTASRPGSVRFYVRASESNSASCYFVLVGDVYNTEVIWFYANESGNFYVNGDVGGDASYPYAVNQWYRIEFRNIDWDAKKFDYHIDGTLVKASIPFRNAAYVNQFYRLYLYNFYPTNAWWDGISLGADFAWLAVSPDSGVVAPGDSTSITVKINTGDLDGFEYHANIVLNTNDPVRPDPAIRVDLTIDPPVMSIDEDTLRVTAFSGDTGLVSVTIVNNGEGHLRYTLAGAQENPAFGDSLNPLASANAIKGGIFTVSGPTTLKSFRFFLHVPFPTGMDFMLYESNTLAGPYQVYLDIYQWSADTGKKFYSSGPVSYALVPGKYYFIGLAHAGSVSFFRKPVPLPADREGTRLLAVGSFSGYPAPGTLSPSRTMFGPLYQSLQIEPLFIGSIDPASATVNPHESRDVDIRVLGNFAAGKYHRNLTLASNDPAMPLSTIPMTVDIRFMGITISEDWNLISLPVDMGVNRKSILFPTAGSPAYAFHSSYSARETLLVGEGFWIKYGSEQLIPLAGDIVSRETVDVDARWNLLGPASSLVPVTSVSAVPPLIIQSNFIGYSNDTGYFNETELTPGRGYWVRVNQGGKIVFDQPGLSAALAAGGPGQGRIGVMSARQALEKKLSSLLITDASGKQAWLYFSSRKGEPDPLLFELPPPPPDGAFDVRFVSQRNYEALDPASSGRREYSIMISGARGPLAVRWNIGAGDGGYALEVKNAGRVIGVYPMEGEGTTDIPQMEDVSVRLVGDPEGYAAIPADYALEQNYPNPFNPATVIRYQLPVESRVTVKIFNVLGEEVERLVDQNQGAGYKSVEWKPAGLASGVYLYRIEAVGSKDISRVFTQSRKMILVK